VSVEVLINLPANVELKIEIPAGQTEPSAGQNTTTVCFNCGLVVEVQDPTGRSVVNATAFLEPPGDLIATILSKVLVA
jgi:hypothetical protein